VFSINLIKHRGFLCCDGISVLDKEVSS